MSEEIIAELQSKNKHLSDLLANQDKEVERLRDLLKECKEYLSDVDTYFTKNADESYLLITRINDAIGESEASDETC